MQTNILQIGEDMSSERGDQWRRFLCEMLHAVEVQTSASRPFAATITAKRHGDISCAIFWSNAHAVSSVRESYDDAGRSGYLLSWQIEGHAHIVQDGDEMHLSPGTVAIIDARRAMSIRFSDNVRRIVTKLPAPMLEHKIPALIQRHHFAFEGSGPFSDMLFTSLSELAGAQSLIDGAEVDLLSENICNLLRFNLARAGLDKCDDKNLRRQAIIDF